MIPTSIVVDGTEYELATSDMQFAFSVYGELEIGDTITVIWENKNSSDSEDEDSLEYQWAADVLPLPCDQRYGKEEMQYMAERIKEWEAAGE